MAEVIIKELDQPSRRNTEAERRTVIENAEEAVYEERRWKRWKSSFLMDRFGYMKLIIDKNCI